MFTLWDLMTLPNKTFKCFINLGFSLAIASKLGYASIELLRKLQHNEHIHGLSKLEFEKDHIFYACQIDKQIRIILNLKYDGYLKALQRTYGFVWSN